MGTLRVDDWGQQPSRATMSDYERALKVMTKVDFDELKRCVDAEQARRYQKTTTSNNTVSVGLPKMMPSTVQQSTVLLAGSFIPNPS